MLGGVEVEIAHSTSEYVSFAISTLVPMPNTFGIDQNPWFFKALLVNNPVYRANISMHPCGMRLSIINPL